MNDFTQLVDLASERLGGRVLVANDEFFAPKENLLKPTMPVYIDGKYTEAGKWMDGWETRRRRTPGFDWCIIQLGLPGILRGVIVDTSHFKGNYPDSCSLEACALEELADIAVVTAPEIRWIEVLPKSQLHGDGQNPFTIDDLHRYTHLRFKVFPDGGIARLRVHGDVIPDWKQLLAGRSNINLAAVQHGARIVACSDMFFSSPQNLLLPGSGMNIGDGWETRRRRGPGYDWVIVQLGIAGRIERIEVDTAYFRGNYPESCSLDICEAAADALNGATVTGGTWQELLPRSPLRPDTKHVFEITHPAAATHVRFNIYPDGGVSRLRIHGLPTREGRAAAALRYFNALPVEAAEHVMLGCCGSTVWAAQMSQCRPFVAAAQLFDAADQLWDRLTKDDWVEAFSRHPRIGERLAVAAGASGQAERWSAQEQSAVAQAAAPVLAALAKGNEEYARRFGYTFIVCASGKSAQEMLDLLKRRLANDPETELSTAAEEQRKIMRLRLEKFLEL